MRDMKMGHKNAEVENVKCETCKMRETQNMYSRMYRNAATLAYCVECEVTAT